MGVIHDAWLPCGRASKANNLNSLAGQVANGKARLLGQQVGAHPFGAFNLLFFAPSRDRGMISAGQHLGHI
ncbi:MAG: hypothetical protein RLY88_1109 [Actinomycetota bacterium]